MTKTFTQGVHKITFVTDGNGCTVTAFELMGNRWVTLWSELWRSEAEALEEYGYNA